MVYTWWIRCPEILTQLGRYGKSLHFLTAEQQIHAKRYRNTVHLSPVRLWRSCRKVALLIKFIVVWQIALRYQSEQAAVADRCRNVIELAVLFPGKSHKDQCVLFPGMHHDMVQLHALPP